MYIIFTNLLKVVKTIIHVLNMYVCAVLLPIKMLTYLR